MKLFYILLNIIKIKKNINYYNNNLNHFIDNGENISKKGPNDKTGTSYAFDIYDFANGTYKYEI